MYNLEELNSFHNWVIECSKKKEYLEVDSKGFTNTEALILMHNTFNYYYRHKCINNFNIMLRYFNLLLPYTIRKQIKDENGEIELAGGHYNKLDFKSVENGEIKINDTPKVKRKYTKKHK